ncbi:carbamoyl-phosphate synthase (glutamine-hydrolyzing) large subunit [Candidatus Parcubacteria bacterium]|nr:MAG: carbamoyl-phosphate synthase (glutamine-hydrolyzing) large subunit [Candidatus Parcubacteria bacterium]
MTKPKKILLLGSGGLRIGQAGEFDYSGSQAIKAFKEEGIKVVLMNPNIATVQTDLPRLDSSGKAGEGFADRVYFLPLTEEFAAQVIEKEKPDAIALSFGGQTALNLGLALEANGVLKKNNVRVLGTPVSVIRDTEDRELFVQKLKEINVKTARSIATSNEKEALAAAKEIGFPIMVRAGFALGGEGSGLVRDEKELKERIKGVFRSVSQLLIEEYLAGWKEVEYEVVRDAADNCITVCNMENVDPMGVHTGESIVVAPSQTLSNVEYHGLREVAIKTIRHLGIVGECNIQYALNPHPETGELDYRVIEVNARLSRSSALASKATGYPLAAVAAKLILGYTLPELRNSITKKTTACFEPALDYLVLKMPRWDLNKFDNAANRIGSEMKSVGEVMAIGRSFEEVLQKALRMINIGADGFTAHRSGNFKIKDYKDHIQNPTTQRIFAIAEAFRDGITVEEIHEWSGIDVWFLEKMRNIMETENRLTTRSDFDPSIVRKAKKDGFSDAQIATITKKKELEIRDIRKKAGIIPAIKQIDTLAGEFPAETNYLYLTYHGSENDVQPGSSQIAVLGSGPYAIGTSVEFDWSCVQVLKTLRAKGLGTIMINSNPETVSTDYDISDRLYFDELTLERVLDIVEFENPQGIVVSTGGQIANNLALKLLNSGVKVMGTDPKDIDKAESRHEFSKLLDELGVDQPEWTEITTWAAAKKSAAKMGYPVLVRPSYVLSGAAMRIAHDEESLEKFLKKAADVSSDHPVVISKFVENAREIEIDGVCKGGELVIYAISEHVENAGTHSGDATVVLPPQRTYLETIRRAKDITKKIAKSLNITGPFNIQFLAKDNRIQVIECNVRASRSFPFVSKVTGYNFIELATRAMLGDDVSGHYRTVDLDYVAVKSPQFSFSRIKGADPVRSVEMASTGEVAVFGDSYSEALVKSMMAADFKLPQKAVLVSLGKEENKIKLLESIKQLEDMKFKIYATENTADFLMVNGVECEKVFKISTEKSPNVSELLTEGTVDLIINIPTKGGGAENSDGFTIRRQAIDLRVPLITNRQLAEGFIHALSEIQGSGLEAKAWDEYRQ